MFTIVSLSASIGRALSTLIEKDQKNNPKDNFSVLADKLDTFQNFFLTEVSDIKVDINSLVPDVH